MDFGKLLVDAWKADSPNLAFQKLVVVNHIPDFGKKKLEVVEVHLRPNLEETVAMVVAVDHYHLIDQALQVLQEYPIAGSYFESLNHQAKEMV